jgi:hypothetical protein
MIIPTGIVGGRNGRTRHIFDYQCERRRQRKCRHSHKKCDQHGPPSEESAETCKSHESQTLRHRRTRTVHWQPAGQDVCSESQSTSPSVPNRWWPTIARRRDGPTLPSAVRWDGDCGRGTSLYFTQVMGLGHGKSGRNSLLRALASSTKPGNPPIVGRIVPRMTFAATEPTTATPRHLS